MRHENVNVNVMNATTSDRDQAFESLINIIGGTQGATADGMKALLDSKEGDEAWSDLQDISEAVGRKYGVMPDKGSAWKAFAERVGRRQHRRRFARIATTVFAAAAAIALLLMVVLPQPEAEHPATRPKFAISEPKAAPMEKHTAMNIKPVQKAGKPVVLTVGTHARETRHLVLADGTEVWLNAKSSLTYPERFTGSERKVKLNGEGYFKVTRDVSHPFIIEAGYLLTKVLGTEFNVRCYDRDNTHVTLVDGIVEVSTNGDRERINPGEDATLENGSLKVSRINTKDFTSWRHGIMYFDNASLRAILQEMGSWYGLNVICNDNGLLDHHFHFMYNRNAPVEEALQLLNDASEVNAKLDGDAIVVE